ncbi:DegQ family serine endoprotease [Oleisolibacter albus]|uniref:DegQ family serine endoprotease n=1 Tax=Oleisolibacter albus TaxID=2171757 RepID=UPI001EFCE941|nr:DegQ family serine endoprotease [Oleisolibacter albus]
MTIPVRSRPMQARPALARLVPWLLILTLLAALLSGGLVHARSAPESFAPLAERILPAVVNISTTQTIQANRQGRSPVPMPEFPPGSPFEEFFRDFFDRQQQDPNAPPRRAQSLGSGFIIDSSGYVVTNNHVIDGADEITVILQDADQTELKAELVGTDKETDLALLKVKADRKLPALSWGDSDGIKVGDWVVAIGNPFGLGGTVTAGIISARARDIGAGRFDDFLQTDAAINRGNSGGPLVNLEGEIIGINTAIFSQTGGSIGIGFAIPANMAKGVIAQLREGGKVRRGWLGVQIQSITPEEAEALGLKEPKGALVGVVTPDSPAAKAGIKPGDVILTFDGKEVANNRALPRMVAEMPVNKKVSVVIFRKGERQTIPLTLGEFPEQPTVQANLPGGRGGNDQDPAQQTVDSVGMTVAALTPELRKQFELAEQSKGVVVTRVAPNSPAQQRQLKPGDIIVEVSQQEVATPADVQDRVKKAQEAGQKAVLLLIERQGELQFLALSLGEG